MSFKNKYIKIIDWAGNELYHGEYDSPDVDKILDANRCACEDRTCLECDGTGYIGDFEVLWEDESDKDECNVYEYINY